MLTDLLYMPATNKGYGFNAFLSVGNQADLSMADYVEYLGEDERTSVIVLYIEGLKDGNRFNEFVLSSTETVDKIGFNSFNNIQSSILNIQFLRGNLCRRSIKSE